MVCRACNKFMTDIEIFEDDDFCSRCAKISKEAFNELLETDYNIRLDKDSE